MRISVSISLFVGSLMLSTIACTWAWESFVKNHLYNCTDDFLPIDYLQPGEWVHQPVAVVPQVTSGRSMSEPDTIKAGWSIARLWLLWSSFFAVSVIVSLLLALLPFIGALKRFRTDWIKPIPQS